MSQENVEIVRSIYRAVERGDYSSSEWADPDIEFVAPHEERPMRGVEAMQRSWREFLGAWKDFRAEPEEIIDAGEQVLVLEKVGGSGAPAEGLRSASLFTFREGRVVRLAQYTNRAKGLEAVGLRE